MGMEVFWLGWASLIVIGIISLVWKENPYLKLVEHIAIGGGVAHMLMYAVLALKTTAIDPIQTGKVLLLVPLVIGFFQLGRVTKWKWTARYPTAILVGVGIGLMLAATIEGQIIAQVRDIGESIFGAKNAFEFVSYTLAAIGTLTGFTYFIFTREHKGILGTSARIGRIVLMAGFGIGWGAEVGWFLTSLSVQTETILKFIKALMGIPY